MTNTEAQQVLGTMLMRHNLTDAELEAIGMAGEALEDDWISVENRLPEDDADVLAYYNHPIRNIVTGEISPWHKFFVGHYEAEYDSWSDDEFGHIPVTHWRHLPEPPEVD